MVEALIVGLGNPGKPYVHTRHNLGFMAVDTALTQWGGIWKPEKSWKAEIARCTLVNHSVLLVKPQTFMNLSGQSVGPLARYYNINADKVLLVIDDINLPFGRMRFRASGSPGGHNGLKSIEQHLGTAEYPRLRLGVGLQPGSQPLVDHVLSNFNPEETRQLPVLLDHAVTVMTHWLTHTTDQLLPLANGWTLS